MVYEQRIVADPEVLLGKPCIKGTRITVELIVRKLSEGESIDSLLAAYPHLTKDDVLAALSYCAEVVGREELIAG
jgi:uncharacterized protein (DUF433 family)